MAYSHCLLCNYNILHTFEMHQISIERDDLAVAAFFGHKI